MESLTGSKVKRGPLVFVFIVNARSIGYKMHADVFMAVASGEMQCAP
jgi:hypothetical protein